jgi:hypothetical protein
MDLFAEAFAEPLAFLDKGLDPAGIDALYLGNYSCPSETPKTMQDPQDGWSEKRNPSTLLEAVVHVPFGLLRVLRHQKTRPRVIPISRFPAIQVHV